MDLTPREIQEKQFHDVFRGYSHEEVDMFLDEVAMSFEKIFRENQTLHHRMKDLEEQLTQARGTEDMLKRTLLTAQKTAEEAVDEARQKAQAMIAASERKAQEIVATAERRSQEILASAVTKEKDIQAGLDGLRRFEGEYKQRLRAFIESQLNVLEEGPVAPDLQPPATPEGPPVEVVETHRPEVVQAAPQAEVPQPAAVRHVAAPDDEVAAATRGQGVGVEGASPAASPDSSVLAASQEIVGPGPVVAAPVLEVTEGSDPEISADAAGEESSDQAVEIATEVTSVSIPEAVTNVSRATADNRPPGRNERGPAGREEEDDEEKSIKQLFWGED